MSERLMAWIAVIAVSLAILTLVEKVGHGAQPDTERIKLTVELPKQPLTLADVNNGATVCTLTVENTGKATDVYPIWPFLSLRVLDAQGKEVKRSKNIGRWGLVKKSILEDIKFITLRPEQKHKFEVVLSNYTHDPVALTGWKLPAAGAYKLELHYLFDRPEVKKKFGKNAKDLDDPAQPWNNAYQYDKKLEVKIQVQP